MTGEKGETAPKPNIADGVVDLVHGAQKIRRAARAETVGIVKKTAAGVSKVADAIGDL